MEQLPAVLPERKASAMASGPMTSIRAIGATGRRATESIFVQSMCFQPKHSSMPVAPIIG